MHLLHEIDIVTENGEEKKSYEIWRFFLRIF